jgi:hypothetical protein
MERLKPGGDLGYGTVFRVNTNGSDFAVLKHFAWAEGTRLQSALTLSRGILYGTALEGGGRRRDGL